MGACWSSVQEVLLQEESTPAAGDIGVKPGAPLSPVYTELPSSAKQHLVRNVYDGDTLTLVENEQRVRFLGIDTPELKEKQAYAQEAKDYTKERCHKKDVWITFEPSYEKEDHYGRWLAFVWVPAPGGRGYLCVNEGIVAAGLATVYTPSKSKKLHNWDKLLALQKQARSEGRGMWSTFEDYAVVKTANGAAFHKRGCEHLSNVKHLTDLKASEAIDSGLHPCRTCLADA